MGKVWGQRGRLPVAGSPAALWKKLHFLKFSCVMNRRILPFQSWDFEAPALRELFLLGGGRAFGRFVRFFEAEWRSLQADSLQPKKKGKGQRRCVSPTNGFFILHTIYSGTHGTKRNAAFSKLAKKMGVGAFGSVFCGSMLRSIGKERISRARGGHP